MKTFREFINENWFSNRTKEVEGVQYSVVLKGSSIGEKNISSLRDLKGEKIEIKEYTNLYNNVEDAKADAKSSNKQLSPGEKNYYGLKYIVAELEDGIFTGK